MRVSMKPHEGWKASKNVSKLYSFPIKGRTERDQEGKKWKKKLGTLTCHSLKKCKLAQCPDVRDATVCGTVCQAALQKCV